MCVGTAKTARIISGDITAISCPKQGRGFNFSRLPKELAETDTQVFKGELGSMRDVLGEIQSEMYKSMEKNKPAKSKEQER